MWTGVGGLDSKNFRINVALQKQLSCSLKLIRLTL